MRCIVADGDPEIIQRDRLVEADDLETRQKVRLHDVIDDRQGTDNRVGAPRDQRVKPGKVGIRLQDADLRVLASEMIDMRCSPQQRDCSVRQVLKTGDAALRRPHDNGLRHAVINIGEQQPLLALRRHVRIDDAIHLVRQRRIDEFAP